MGVDNESDEEHEAPGDREQFENIDFDEEPAGDSEEEEAESVAGKGTLHDVRRGTGYGAKVDSRQMTLATSQNSFQLLETANEEMEVVVESTSKPKLGGKKKRGGNTEDLRQRVIDLFNDMEEAANKDFQSNLESKPAIEKLKLLPNVEEICMRRDAQRLLLDEGILGVLKSWIEPFEDRSLPNVKIRTAVLKILQKLPIDTAEQMDRQNLKTSQIGSRVMLLSRVSQETRENRKMAWDLVQRWCRPIFEQARRDDDDDRKQDALNARKRRLERERTEEERKKILKPGDPDFKYVASRPQPSRLDYVIKPPSRVDPDLLPNQKKINMFQEFKKPKKGRFGK